MVVGENEDDVRLLGGSGRQKAADQTEKKCQKSHGVMTIYEGESVSVNRQRTWVNRQPIMIETFLTLNCLLFYAYAASCLYLRLPDAIRRT